MPGILHAGDPMPLSPYQKEKNPALWTIVEP